MFFEFNKQKHFLSTFLIFFKANRTAILNKTVAIDILKFRNSLKK